MSARYDRVIGAAARNCFTITNQKKKKKDRAGIGSRVSCNEEINASVKTREGGIL